MRFLITNLTFIQIQDYSSFQFLLAWLLLNCKWFNLSSPKEKIHSCWYDIWRKIHALTDNIFKMLHSFYDYCFHTLVHVCYLSSSNSIWYNVTQREFDLPWSCLFAMSQTHSKRKPHGKYIFLTCQTQVCLLPPYVSLFRGYKVIAFK